MMRAVILFLLIAKSAIAAPEPFIHCLSGSAHVRTIDIYMVNFKDVPDVYTGKLSACTFVPAPDETFIMETVYPASGSTVTGSDGNPRTFWTAAVVVDENNKATIFYQYSDFIARSITLENPTPCTQGLFISDAKQVLDFKSNEPGFGMGRATLNGERIEMGCQSK